MATAGIGMAANIVGGELQGWAALLDKWGMQDVYNKERGTQQGFANQAQQIVNNRIPGAGSAAAQQQLAQGAQAREAQYKSVNATPLSLSPAPLSSVQNARDSAYAGLLGGLRGKLGSYGDWLQNQWVANQQTNRGLNQVTNFAQGQANNVYPLQMYQAQHSMDDLAAIGQAISSIGGAAGNYAALYNTPNQSNNVNNPNLNGLFQGQLVDSSGQQMSFDQPQYATV